MKKIMFSDKFGLTEAVLSGRKTQTRRMVPQKDLDKACEFAIAYFNETFDVFADDKDVLQHYFFVEEIGKLPYRVGEVVAVAQSYKDCNDGIIEAPNLKGFTDKRCVVADLMPHQIRITNVRVERLQDISDEDCIAEGVEMWRDLNDKEHYCFFDKRCKGLFSYSYSTPREAYVALIDRISGKGTFESNPYVFVYEFELIK